MMDETQERFLRAIAEQIAPERVVEVHLFSAIRQGPNESRVAVIAAEPEVPADAAAPDAPADPSAADDSSSDDDAPSTDDPSSSDDEPVAAAEECSATPEQGDEPSDHPPPDAPESAAPSTARRLTIYRAQYRLVLKGADRGTWDVNITAEADAPIETVDEVVRGVRQRAGEDAEPERLTGSAFRAVVACEPWTTTP